MRASICTSYIVELTPREMTRVFAGFGWEALELSEEHGHDLLKEGDPFKTGESFKRYAREQGIHFAQGHFCMSTKGCRPDDKTGKTRVDIAPLSDADFIDILDYMKRWIDLFNSVGIEAGVIHPGGDNLFPEGWSSERILHRRAEALRKIAEYSKGGPTQICIENTFLPGTQTASELIEIIEASGAANTGICLDTGHSNINNVDPADFINKAGRYLKALHVADNMGKVDEHILPYGKGTVRWEEVVKALHLNRYKGLFNFEISGENKCPMPVKLAKLEYIKKLGEWMIELREDGEVSV